MVHEIYVEWFVPNRYLKDNFKRKVENEEMQPGGGGGQHLSVNFNSGGNVSHGNQSVGNVNFNLQVQQNSEHTFRDDHASTRLPMVEKPIVGSCSLTNIENVLNLLKQDDVSFIGIHGMGGVGKTTSVRLIYNKLLQDPDMNEHVYWVTASRDCSLLKLQNAIGKCLGLRNIGEEDEEGRKSWIFHTLVQLQKSVLIIDDLWSHEYATDEIGIPLDSCKILITTRSLEVCQKVGCQKFIKVVPLSEEDAWELFVEKSGVVPNNCIVIAREIVEECGGLPLALVTMGSCMRWVTDVHQWENALYELKKPASRQDDDMDKKVFQILQFSYDSMKDESMKQCFLNCVLFPEDLKITRVQLIELWITEGLLDDVEGWENKVNKGHTILNRLEGSSLLEPTTSTSHWRRSLFEPTTSYSRRCVRMHDLIRDMAMILAQRGTLCMAKAGLQLNKVPEQEQWTCDLVKVSLSHNNIEEIPQGMSPETPKLRVLILSNNPLKEIPESFFVHMKALQMLDLSRTRIKRLPDTVSDLENLRGLFLQDCDELTRVPSLAKLTKLMVLDLSGTECLKRGVEGLERLKCLEKVYNFCFPCSELDVPSFNNLMLSGQLKLYRICFAPKGFSGHFAYENFYGSDGPLYYEKEIRILGLSRITQVSLPSTIQSFVIERSGIKGQRSLEEVCPSLRHATDLRNLVIKKCDRLEYVCSGDSLYHHPLQSPWFFNLKRLSIWWCRKIRVLFPSMQTQQHQIILPYLESISVVGCDEVEEIIESNKESSSSQTIDNIMNATFPNLRSLYLARLPRLGSLYSMQLHLCTSLDNIEIIDCPKIEGIFSDTISKDGINTRMNLEKDYPSLALPNLSRLRLIRLSRLGTILPLQLHLCTSLEKLEIHDCSYNIEGVFRDPINNTQLVSSLKEVELSGLQEVRSLYLPTSLETINLSDCPKIEGVFTYNRGDAELVSGLPSLSELELSRLPELRCIYPMRLHLCTSLVRLTVKECPKLEEVFTNPTGAIKPILALPNLDYLKLVGLPSMSSVYRGLLMCPHLGVEGTIKKCPQLKVLPLSDTLICDASPSTVASFPTQSEDPEWWEPLQRDHPDDVISLSDYIHQARRLSTMPQEKWSGCQQIIPRLCLNMGTTRIGKHIFSCTSTSALPWKRLS